jgi:hypothetical protein
VIWHEYGHAIQDDIVPGFGETEEAARSVRASATTGPSPCPCRSARLQPAVRDGLGRDVVHAHRAALPASYRHRKTTDDMTGEVHDDGEIWSNALWDIHQAPRPEQANKVILEVDVLLRAGHRLRRRGPQRRPGRPPALRKARAAQVTKAFQDPQDPLTGGTRSCAHGYCGRMTWSTADIPDLTGRRALVNRRHQRTRVRDRARVAQTRRRRARRGAQSGEGRQASEDLARASGREPTIVEMGSRRPHECRERPRTRSPRATTSSICWSTTPA